MKTIHRYVLQEMLPSFLLSAAILTFLLMTNRIFLSLDLVLNKKVNLGEALLLYACLLPYVLSITIPMAMMMGTLLAFGRLSSDMEVTAFKSGGGHLLHLILPVLALGSVLTLGMLFFNDRILPASKFLAKKTQFNMVKKKADLAIRERVFIDQFEGHQFYIDRQERDGSYSDVKVFDRWARDASVQTTLAKKGILESDQAHYQVFFHLSDGVMSWDNRNYQTFNRLFFERYTIHLNLENQLTNLTDIKRDYEELSLREISQAIPLEKDAGRLNHLRTEYQYRLALPFACLVLPWFCAPLGLWIRSKGFLGFVLGIVLIFVYYLMFTFGQTLSNEGRIDPRIGLWGADLALLLGGSLVYLLAVTEQPLWKAGLKTAGSKA